MVFFCRGGEGIYEISGKSVREGARQGDAGERLRSMA